MKKILFTIMALFSFVCVQAEGESAVYVWVDGSKTCYQLESMPKITISGDKALLTLNGKSEPELTLEIKEGANIKTVFGVYDKSTGIQNVEVDSDTQGNVTSVRQCGKYIIGGKLVIVKNGKKYNINGTEIK